MNLFQSQRPHPGPSGRVGRVSALNLWALLLACVAPWTARAQWATQTLVLQPGWNAVWLEVQPEPRDTDAVFGSLPVESVWCWNRRFTSIQYLQDADTLLPGQPDWLSYFPLAQGNAALTTLFAVHAGRCYLVKSTAAQPVTWTLQGRPVPIARDWIAGSLNLAGFAVDPAAPPTFASFFAPSPAHAGQPVLRLQPNGTWRQVTNLAGATLRSGEAFWINTASPSSYNGPLGVGVEQRLGINFGKTLPETLLTLKNPSAVARTLVVTPGSSQAPPTGLPGLAGDVPLSYWRMDLASKVYGWYPLDGPASFPVAAGQQVQVRLAIRRRDLPAYPLVTGVTNYQYQSVLSVTDQAGSVVRLPVTASGGRPAPASPGTAPEPASDDPHAGLWVGSAAIHAVSQPASLSDPNAPRPTGSVAQFRVIIHVNSQGRARLLQQVTLMWTNGVVDVQGNSTQPGQRVLITDDALLANYTGAALRDGKPVGRRISSVVFSHPAPIDMTGPFGDVTTPLTATVTVGYDDPLNPFKHRFHPDHDNLDAEYASVLPEGLESFTVNRALQLSFSSEDPEGLATSRFGGDQLGGQYVETVTGLHRKPIVVQGTFRLNRVSLVKTLNQQN